MYYFYAMFKDFCCENNCLFTTHSFIVMEINLTNQIQNSKIASYLITSSYERYEFVNIRRPSTLIVSVRIFFTKLKKKHHSLLLASQFVKIFWFLVPLVLDYLRLNFKQESSYKKATSFLPYVRMFNK